MRFILANFGEKYSGMLAACLESIIQNIKDAQVSVYWEEMDADVIKPIIESYEATGKVDFIETSFGFKNDEFLRVSSKAFVWELALAKECSDNFVFLDVDTVVLSSLGELFETNDSDIFFCVKPTAVPINAGVMFAKGSAKMYKFLKTWNDETKKIFESEELSLESAKKPYAGADQMSLYQLIGYENGRVDFDRDIGGAKIAFKAVGCDKYNHTFATPLDDSVKIVHFKGDWNSKLLNGAIPAPANFEKVALFKNYFDKALGRMRTSGFEDVGYERFGVKLHSVAMNDSMSRMSPRYQLERLKFKMKNSLAKRFKRKSK